MDPVTGAVITIIGKYAVDQGVALAKEYGPQAAEIAKDLLQRVLDRIRRKEPLGGPIADAYEADPQGTQTHVQTEVAQAVADDPSFKEQLEQLIAQFETQAAANAAGQGRSYTSIVTGDHNITVTGDGNVTAVGGSVAAGGNIGDVTLPARDD